MIISSFGRRFQNRSWLLRTIVWALLGIAQFAKIPAWYPSEKTLVIHMYSSRDHCDEHIIWDMCGVYMQQSLATIGVPLSKMRGLGYFIVTYWWYLRRIKEKIKIHKKTLKIHFNDIKKQFFCEIWRKTLKNIEISFILADFCLIWSDTDRTVA